MKLFKIIGVIILTSILQACPGGEETLIGHIGVKNSTTTNIYIHENYYRCNPNIKELPNINYLHLLKPNATIKIGVIKEFFEGDKFWILIFKQSTIDKYSWKEIQEKNLYDKKYAFTLKELEAINYTIVYDGK